MATGADLSRLAESRIGEKYVNVLVPKNNPNWHGPWDCAEFVSWVVYQTVAKLYGCVDNQGNPATIESYSGAWSRDARDGTLRQTNYAHALSAPGVVLVRRPPVPGRMGHVAVSDGRGKCIEAAAPGLGVRRGPITGRLWHYYSLIPDLQYVAPTAVDAMPPALPFMLELTDPWTKNPLVKKVQNALRAAGFDPGPADGEFGPNTLAAVFAFQRTNRLVGDGIVGPKTAVRLGLTWPEA